MKASYIATTATHAAKSADDIAQNAGPGTIHPPVRNHSVEEDDMNRIIFPPMGMTVFATEAKRVTDEMFIVAARAVAEQVGQDSLDSGLIDPLQSNILQSSLHVAAKVAEYIFDHDLARVKRPDDITALIASKTYRPVYPA